MSEKIAAMDAAMMNAIDIPMPPEKDPYKGTDLANAEHFAERYRGELRYCPQGKKWLVWTSTHWSRDNKKKAERLAGKMVRSLYEDAAKHDEPGRRRQISRMANRLEGRNPLMSMLHLAKSYLAIDPSELDTDLWLLNCGNGTVDLRTGQLMPHQPEHYITRCLPVDYSPDAKCDAWRAFLGSVFGGNSELIGFIQRAVGYSLTGDTSEQAMFVLHGAGSNGKSTLLTILQNLLAGYARQAAPNLLLAKRSESHPTGLADLFGCRMVVSSESGEGRQFDEALVKHLTGGDLIRARRMHEDFWEFVPTHKLWLATNHKPGVKGTDHAIWRRIYLVPFNQTFYDVASGKIPVKDPTLTEKLRGELPGILRWAVEGSLAWQKQGLAPPEIVRQATKGYQTEMDVVGQFLSECCATDNPAAVVKSKDLYEGYRAWCQENGESPETQRRFGQKISDRGFVRVKNNAIWYRGVRLLAGVTGGVGGSKLFYPETPITESSNAMNGNHPPVPPVLSH
ncbi:phage/plasmid primase, P4 family [Ralstonia solanacearum]|uniref:Phage/plasmid primase, P4 family n=1 Tax=Ralstonia solanacearum TaxID=305 RepID=A0AAW5ZSZ1_RALSL|nr:phage/plasmid primase, P4 family [Ralstonia solanacearum]MDB0573093.1 phage/plasmid primase, P4 family [Ralstonia solanacearum]